MEGLEGLEVVLLVIWYVFYIIQGILSYGTAYRLTKAGGDNGVALFGWMLVLGLASAVPGLGIYLYLRYKNTGVPVYSYYQQPYYQQPQQQYFQNPQQPQQTQYSETPESDNQ